jgi:hypothetical protein
VLFDAYVLELLRFVTATLCAATFSNSYVLWHKRSVMLRFVAVPLLGSCNPNPDAISGYLIPTVKNKNLMWKNLLHIINILIFEEPICISNMNFYIRYWRGLNLQRLEQQSTQGNVSWVSKSLIHIWHQVLLLCSSEGRFKALK